MTSLVGYQLGKYKLVAKLGRGGMAEVYKAFQPGLNRYVAIKVMHRHLAEDEEFLSRFRREALATGRLRHQNIVQVLDFDQADGTYFMVLEFVDGPTLKDELRQRIRLKQPFDLPETARIFTALCDAIDVAHSHNMIHRDLKPANVMLTQQGQVLLTDFGIARVMDGTQYTATGAVAGTPAYMSPEQGQGNRGDKRSDIYSLGIMLYEVVTGTVPYDADTPYAVVIKHISDPLPLPTQVNPNIPEVVERVVLKAMAKSPDDRYQTGGDLALDLREACQLKPGDSLRRNPITVLAPPPKVEEINPQTGRFVTPASHTPISQTNYNTDSTMPAGPIDDQTVLSQATSSTSKTPLYIGIAAAVLLLILGGVAFYLMNQDTGSETDIAVNQTATAAMQTTATVDALANIQNEATATWLAEDDDRDGLTNEEELRLGTLPGIRDTDEDGLSDGEEVNERKTDPLRADTDRDGIRDGEELSRGLNPLSEDTDGDGIPDARDPNPRQAEPGQATISPTEAVESPDTPTPADEPDELTEEPTTTPEPTEEPTLTPTPEPTEAVADNDTSTGLDDPSEAATSTTSSVASAVSSPAGPGVFLDFETQSSWRRGDQNHGNFTRSADEVYSGEYAGQLAYDFPAVEDNFVVFLQSKAIPGKPNLISAMVYGDSSGHYLNVWLKDAQGEVRQATFGQIKHTGWQTMTAILDPERAWPNGSISGSDNGAFDYPLSFNALVLDGVPDNSASDGTIYLDELTAREISALPDPSAEISPGVTPTPKSLPTQGRLAFPVDNGSGRYDIWMIRLPDGEPFVAIQGARQPNFLKKDGRLLANGQNNPSGYEHILMANYNFDQIIQVSGSPYDERPFWDPDGTRLVYENSNLISGFAGRSFIFVQCTLMRPEEEPNQECREVQTFGVLTSGGGELVSISPVWTRDGRHLIAFLGLGGNARTGINIIGSWATKRDLGDQEQPQLLLPQARSLPTDAYSDRLYFFSDSIDGNWEAYSIRTDGSGLINISDSPHSSDGLPTVSPDGQWVAFVSDRDGKWAVYVAPASGGPAQKLFDFPKNNPWATGDRDWTNERITWGP